LGTGGPDVLHSSNDFLFSLSVLVNASVRCFPFPLPITERKHTALRTKSTAVELEHLSTHEKRGLVVNMRMLIVHGMRDY